jgi:hypothetical protein
MDEKLMRVARVLMGERATPGGSIPRPQLPSFMQPGSAFNNAMPQMAANSPQQAAPMPPQTVAAAPVAPPGGLLPAMLPAAQPAPVAPSAPQPQGYTDEQRAAMDALVKRVQDEQAQQNVPSWWHNPWQAP